jgi:hypothetical protein
LLDITRRPLRGVVEPCFATLLTVFAETLCAVLEDFDSLPPQAEMSTAPRITLISVRNLIHIA